MDLADVRKRLGEIRRSKEWALGYDIDYLLALAERMLPVVEAAEKFEGCWNSQDSGLFYVAASVLCARVKELGIKKCKVCGGEEYHEPGWGGYPGPVSDCPKCALDAEPRTEQGAKASKSYKGKPVFTPEDRAKMESSPFKPTLDAESWETVMQGVEVMEDLLDGVRTEYRATGTVTLGLLSHIADVVDALDAEEKHDT